MPHACLSTPTGDISMAYHILTPQSAFATQILPDFPTIVFIHGVYVAGLIFEPQASDPMLRQYNLVIMDLRGHGDTVGRPGRKLTPTETADDVFRLMTHLKLPPSHFFGLSIGSSAATELAIAHPDVVLSLTLCSPLPPQEPDMALSGREDIWDCFYQATKNGPLKVDTDAMSDCVYGTLQMMVNNTTSKRLEAVTALSLPKLAEKWAFTPENFEDGYAIICDWYRDRRALTPIDLSQIRCPVKLIYCEDDLPYPRAGVLETENNMRSAKLNVSFHSVPGPHYGNLTNPENINHHLRDMVSAHDTRPGSKATAREIEPMMTPWHDALEKNGYYSAEPTDEDSDMETEPSLGKRIR